MRLVALAALCIALAACSTAPKKPAPPAAGGAQPAAAGSPQAGTGVAGKDCSRYAPVQEDPSTRGDYVAGGLYKPGVPDSTPDHVPDLDCISEPQVVHLPRSPVGNRSPYKVLDKSYHVLESAKGYVEQGIASYYGNKFHGRRTSNQEVYDMYAFTAAHKHLPLPSFARVTNLDNGKSVIVRVNDRGPFHDGRVIDLSYAAAYKLGITARGTGRVEVRGLTPDDVAREATVLAKAEAAAPRPAPAAGQPSPMDALVTNMPAQAQAPVSVQAPVQVARTEVPGAGAAAIATAVPSARDDGYRYRVVPEAGKPASADRFDAWLQSQGLQVVGGKIVPVGSAAAPAMAATPAAPAPVPVAAPPAATTATTTASSATPAEAAAPPAAQVWLQVASFASRENAEKALARLLAAKVEGARLSDATSNGRTLWRLRVGAPDAASAEALAGRIASLGFGPPQRVRE